MIKIDQTSFMDWNNLIQLFYLAGLILMSLYKYFLRGIGSIREYFQLNHSSEIFRNH